MTGMARRLIPLFLLAVLLVAARLGLQLWREHRYDGLILRAAERYAADPALVRAVVRVESGFRANARGAAGEVGLMQVRAGAGREWARAEGIADFHPDHLEDPMTNLLAGTWYLARARRRWADRDDPNPFALAEYNAGRSNALRWAAAASDPSATSFVAAITFPGTRAYIEHVLSHSQKGP